VTLLKALGLLAALGAAWVAFLFFLQRPALFPAPRAAMGDRAALERARGESASLQLPFGAVESWLLPPIPERTPAPLLIYAHGNGELIDFWAESFGELRAAGLAVLLVEYPGYGRSGGTPSQASIGATLRFTGVPWAAARSHSWRDRDRCAPWCWNPRSRVSPILRAAMAFPDGSFATRSTHSPW
jgi:hypothetical protein